LIDGWKMRLALNFRNAESADADLLVELINSAYRGDSSRRGWTTEADLLMGRRTDAAEILALLADSDSMLMLCQSEQAVLGSVLAQRVGERALIGMLAVAPDWQAQGIGKQLLNAVEAAALQDWATRRFAMSVIPSRHELIAFYERRGYRRTGVIKPFPMNPDLWSPIVEGLSLEILEKAV
jgi:ribosomal protein S18 acetylase RimI-like enzyme